MISYIEGKVIDKENKKITIKINGLGYEIFVGNCIEKFNLNDNVELYIQLILRENDVSLYGFIQKEQKTLFNTLLLVNGVGPKVALDIISSNDVSNIISAIINENVDFMTKIKGIGKKGAQNIIFTLKDKLTKEEKTKIVITKSSKYTDLYQSFIFMGYGEKEAQKVCDSIFDESLPIEKLIKIGLSKRS